MSGPTPGALPFSPASERNRGPILEALLPRMPACGRLLEIGAGSGQHAVYMAPHFPHLEWLATERSEALPGLAARLDLEGAPNLAPPRSLDVLAGPWPEGPFEAAYSANTAHIMSWEGVCAMIAGVGARLVPGGALFLYGPFNRGGSFTAPSNQAFDRDLRRRDPQMGLRDLEALEALAANHHLQRVEIIDMPANNFLLHFTSRASALRPAGETEGARPR